jgi:CRP-like cAMP-binding protein
MDIEKLIRHLTGITELSNDFIIALEDSLQLEIYRAHQILHAAGHMENRMYFMNNGFARNYYYDHHGNEHTVKFWEAGDMLFSYEGYYKVSSYYYTETMEETHLITLSYANLHELDETFPEMSVLIKTMLLKYQQEEYQRQKLIALPAEERFQLLRKTRPLLFQKAPSRIIASYLHLTRETLTRYIGKR